ncbi:MAG: hypothetical protein ACRCYY_08195 [Trueperaceae bacterium]
MTDIPHPLNILSLARSSHQASSIPNTTLEVFALVKKQNVTLENNTWLLVLEGEAILDLPYGDFRVLKVGDSLQLAKGLQMTMEPLEDTVILRQTV